MKLEVCDICGRTLHPHTKRDLRGAMSVLLGAESVCEECMKRTKLAATVVRVQMGEGSVRC